MRMSPIAVRCSIRTGRRAFFRSRRPARAHGHRRNCTEELRDNERWDIGGPNARNVLENPSAIVAAGLAKEVNAVNLYAAVM